jgi:hypothetical protein
MTTEIAVTWVVMIRDVEDIARLVEDDDTVIGMVFDRATNAVQGVSSAPTAEQACAQAIEMAAVTPLLPVPGGPPSEVVCGAGFADVVRAALAQSRPDRAAPTVTETADFGALEDIVDSYVGGALSGRLQPDPHDHAGPDDWRLLVDLSRRYRATEPWKRWSVPDQLDLVVRVDGVAMRYRVVVVGAEHPQRGVFLYPGATMPSGLYNLDQDGMEPMPQGTLMFYLDTEGDAPPEFRARARRYGWPADSDAIPVWVQGGPGKLTDVGRTDVRHLALALSAVLAHDAPGLPAADRGGTTTGELVFAGDVAGEYSIS